MDSIPLSDIHRLSVYESPPHSRRSTRAGIILTLRMKKPPTTTTTTTFLESTSPSPLSLSLARPLYLSIKRASA
jgi:hypothetical protein